ncbi:universal stress protein [Lentilactobacillus parafarraginis]|uniref:Universal stress family protein n=1 Tax=Lentilactobacillus parafarraginis DSM 18390 = JCM 14109 TaxID=1423786 RepID=A0A0R1YDL9_9LACO|nr:universal stress protein [Lentilactobacillus parafarraginis]KRM40367.1 universal stress family protein [Lentilactobacillus parafarraginis DSM 18390 = JCM 14109]
MYNNILVPIDGSDNANKALDVALDLNKAFGSKITVLTVIHNIHYDSESLRSELYEGLLTNAHKLVEGCRDYAWNKAGVTIDSNVVDGNPKQEIIDFARDRQFDLIIIGKTGTNAINRVFLGSTTAYVVRHADTQVLVVNA